MPERSLVAVTLFVAGMALGIPAWAQTFQIDCYATLQSYRVTNPNLSCTCSSAHSSPSCGGSTSQRSSQGKYPSAKAQAAATITGAVMGAVLASIFSDPGPSPQEIEQERQRAEAQRLAELARAKEEESRHQKLMGSLISVPGRIPAGGGRPVSGMRLTALMEPTTQKTTEILNPASAFTTEFASDEDARAWMSNPETLFAAVWKPLSVGTPLPATPPALPACPVAGQGCEIVVDAGMTPAIGKIGAIPARQDAKAPEVETLRRTVSLLRPKSCVAPCDDWPYFLRAMAASEGLPGRQTQDKVVVTYDLLKQSGKALLEDLTLRVVDASGPIGKVAALYYNVHSLATTVLEDMIKAAGYLGSSNLNAVEPQMTSVAELAAPFAGDTEGVNKLLVESTVMSKKFLDMWRGQQ